MHGFMKIITPEGHVSVEEYREAPNFRAIQAAVGGYLEIIPYFETMPNNANQPCVAYCNEEGKINGMAVNATAQQEWATAAVRAGAVPDAATLARHDVLVGPVVVLWGDEEFMAAM